MIIRPDTCHDQHHCKVSVNNDAACVISTARCQISEDSKEDEVQGKEKKGKKKSKEEKTTPSLASLNSNYREGSSSGSESNERVRHYKLVDVLSYKAHKNPHR